MKSIALTLLLGCFALAVNASQAASQNIALSNINEIAIEAKQNKFNNGDIQGVKLHLVQQDNETLQISAPDNLTEKIKFKASKNKLSIEISPLSRKDVADGIIDIYITTKNAHSIQLIGQIDTILNDYESADFIDIDVQKGGRLNINSLKAPDINLKAAFGAEIQLTHLTTDQLKCSADFGANIHIINASRVNHLDVSGSFGGNVSAPQLSANYGKFAASFGSNLRFNKINDANTSSSFGGDIQLEN